MRDPHIIEIENVRGDYIKLCNHILHYGKLVAPRGQATREVQSLTVIHHQPWKCIVHDINRKENRKLAAAEALQLVAGVSDPQLLASITPNMKQFMDGGSLYGAYGPRISHQMPRVIDKLTKDPDTRQARVQIWRDSDLFSDAKDLPCTMGFTFHLRDGKLDMHTHMRSNDAWWGFTYDITQFCFLQACVAEALNTEMGRYFHHVDSFHIYERDVEAIDAMYVVPDFEHMSVRGYTGNSWWSQKVNAFNDLYHDTQYVTLMKRMLNGQT